MKCILHIIFVLLCSTSSSQDTINIVNDIFMVKYSETLEQPLYVYYVVKCNNGTISRSGMDFRLHEGVKTSDNEDYKNNIWDKGHLAPASAFNCDRETLKKTFTYLNCVLQHEGLNRGPWKELERFEVGLAKVFEDVIVEITVCFDGDLQKVIGGATIPSGFKKKIKFDNNEIMFYFPNTNVSGQDWGHFKIIE